MAPDSALLLVTIGALTAYVIGIGGSTAGAIRIRERFRQPVADPSTLAARPGGRVVISAPSLSRGLRTLRLVGWVAFPVALLLAIFAEPRYEWVAPLAVVVMVALNAFYFTAMQNMGEELTLEPDAFYMGPAGKKLKVRWAHVTEFTGARVGAFSASSASPTTTASSETCSAFQPSSCCGRCATGSARRWRRKTCRCGLGPRD